jgi:transcriptional regulator with XRE-family HTH domain
MTETELIQKTTVGGLICKTRHAKRMTQHQLAERCGVTRPQIANIEAGRCGVTVDRLGKIAQALGVKTIELVPE